MLSDKVSTGRRTASTQIALLRVLQNVYNFTARRVRCVNMRGRFLTAAVDKTVEKDVRMASRPCRAGLTVQSPAEAIPLAALGPPNSGPRSSGSAACMGDFHIFLPFLVY